MLDANEIYKDWEIKKFCELIENEIVYFLYDNGEYKNFTPEDTMEKWIKYFLKSGKIQEYEKLKEENKILKKRIQELTKYKEFSEKFTSLEPKKKTKVTKEELEKIKELKAKKIPVRIIADTYGVTEQTIYNYLKR